MILEVGGFALMKAGKRVMSVVVEDGRKHIGKRTEVSVYSILQTSSGRMIFAKVK